MKKLANVLIVVLLAACAQQPNPRAQLPLPAANRVPAKALSAAEILAQSNPLEWRAIAPENTLVMQTARGTVVLELASAFAPAHVENLKIMARAGYFDGLAITRSQDNFVVQWGDPNAEDASKRKSLGTAKATLAAEFTAAISSVSDFTLLPDADGYAPEVGFSQGFAVGRDKKAGLIWPAHCYGAVGAGRDVGEETGSGAELYVVTGHAPRQLDRNISIVARVISGIDVLSVTQRGPAPMGFYAQAEMRTAITSIRVGSDLPTAQQPQFEALRTDSASFAMLVEARRNRRDEWYKRPAGYIDVCNVPLPVRVSRTIVNTH
jgi:peptidylprolyl isomerase